MTLVIAVQILWTLIISCNGVNAEMTGLLSRLYRNAAQNNRPLVLVIDRSSQQNLKYPLEANDLLQSSDEKEGGIPAIFLIKNFRSEPQKPKVTGQEYKNKLYKGQYQTKSNLQKYKGNRGKLRVYGSTPSPVLKSLLRFKNEVNCEANNECQQECEENYSGAKLANCENNCDEDFECEPEEEPDDCDPESNDCDENQNPSTRGELLATARPSCTRC
ncbi:uncharacterized protein LOC106707967 [Papilio machaon]|uniref:uncharacterized protein LOC106707967 n=1 Tax=Papilio machaon TaxID=76193 RepID=UPI001E6636A0|nr:uncharacterized protein LOC106707967 [Papilio machaon]